MGNYTDPIDSARKAAGTKTKLVIGLLHNLAGVILLIHLFDLPRESFILITILIFIVPGSYLYIIYNCIRVIDHKKPIQIPGKIIFFISYLIVTVGLMSLASVLGYPINSLKAFLVLFWGASIIGAFFGMLVYPAHKKYTENIQKDL